MSAVSTAAPSRSRPQEQDGFVREKVVVVDLEAAAGSPAAGGGGGSRRVAPIPGAPAGTQASPIDVEAIVDGEGRRNRRGISRRHPATVVVDLEVDTVQQGCDDDVITVHSFMGSKRRREERASIQRNDAVRLSRSSANAAPESIPEKIAAPKEPAFTCPVCLIKLEQPSTTTCGHVFCENCIKAAIKAQKKCPTCRKKLGPRSYHRVYLPTTAD